MAVPICTHGPSVPNGTPTRNVINAEIGRKNMDLIQLKLTIPRIAAIDVGMPPPRQLCEKLMIRLARKPKTIEPRRSRGKNAGVNLTLAYIFSDNSTMWDEAILKRVTTSVETIPVMVENTIQGMRRFLM